MLKENILMLRNVNGYSQEEVAEKIGISRQPMQNGKKVKQFRMWDVVKNWLNYMVLQLMHF